MAFNLFQKSNKSGAENRRLEPEGFPTISGNSKLGGKPPPKTSAKSPSDTEMGNWAPLAGNIEVDDFAELGPSLENAALMFAHGNATAATAALTHALDTPERTQPMVWMCPTRTSPVLSRVMTGTKLTPRATLSVRRFGT